MVFFNCCSVLFTLLWPVTLFFLVSISPIVLFLLCTGRDLVDAGQPFVGKPRFWVNWSQSLSL